VLNNLVTRVRDALPKRLQVPAKYWYGYIRGAREREMQLLELIIRKYDRVIDVGGNRGTYAYHLWKLGAVVEVFEPNPRCYSVLAAWAADKPQVKLHLVALSSHEGSASLHIPIDESGVEHDASASIEKSEFEQSRDQLVQLQTLDRYSLDDATLIKIDVEGHEYDVIEGASRTLSVSRPALLVEIEQRHIKRPIGEVFNKIMDFGYQGFFLDKDGLTTLDSFEVSRHQSKDSFGESKELYINNFLFLDRHRLGNGEYGAVVNSDLMK
jgi:FkbM family methyltransferase